MTPGGPPLDADRTLALSYVPTRRRSAIAALWRLDAALGAVLAGGREPLISEIKLAWWRDSLAKLDTARVPAEPILQELAKHALPAGVGGADLARLEDAWTILLAEGSLTAEQLGRYAAGRGALLFRLSASILGARLSPEMERAGEAWALVDLARHSNPADAAAAIEAARERLSLLRWPSRLRPLGMLAALAARDVEAGLERLELPGAPARMLRMLRHRLTGH